MRRMCEDVGGVGNRMGTNTEMGVYGCMFRVWAKECRESGQGEGEGRRREVVAHCFGGLGRVARKC